MVMVRVRVHVGHERVHEDEVVLRGQRHEERLVPEWPKAVNSAAIDRLARASEAVAGRPVGWPLPLGVPGCPEPPGAP